MTITPRPGTPLCRATTPPHARDLHRFTTTRHNPAVGISRRHPPRVQRKCAPYLKHGKPEHRTELLNFDDHLIISTYGAEYRGIVQYYLLAGDVWRLNRLEWVAKTSMLKTLAAKHDTTVVVRRFG